MNRIAKLKRAAVVAASGVVVVTMFSGCMTLIESLFATKGPYKWVYEVQQQYINGEFEANYEVDDYTEYAKQHPTTEEGIAEARQGTKEPWAEMAQRLEEANPWIKDEWILYIPQS